MCKKNDLEWLFIDPGKEACRTGAAPGRRESDSLSVAVEPVNENSLVDPVQAVGKQTHSKHKEDQADYGQWQRAEHKANGSKGGIGDAERPAVFLLFNPFQ
jgi:hypothetical protein